MCLNKSLRGATLMEMMVGMILTGILAGFSYWGYENLNRYFDHAKTSSQSVYEMQVLHTVLLSDIHKCRFILKNKDGFELVNGYGERVSYSIDGDKLVRMNGAHHEGFAVNQLHMESVPELEGSELVSELTLRLGGDEERIEWRYSKKYAPADLFILKSQMR